VCCNTLQYTAIHCNTLLQHAATPNDVRGSRYEEQVCAATHCHALQRPATHCNTLQNTAKYCNALQYTAAHFNTLQLRMVSGSKMQRASMCCNTLRHTAIPHNTLEHTATYYCITLQLRMMSDSQDAESRCILQRTATLCNTLQQSNTLQHTATHYNTLEHTATHSNTLKHTATHCNTLQLRMMSTTTTRKAGVYLCCVCVHILYDIICSDDMCTCVLVLCISAYDVHKCTYYIILYIHMICAHVHMCTCVFVHMKHTCAHIT